MNNRSQWSTVARRRAYLAWSLVAALGFAVAILLICMGASDLAIGGTGAVLLVAAEGIRRTAPDFESEQ